MTHGEKKRWMISTHRHPPHTHTQWEGGVGLMQSHGAETLSKVPCPLLTEHKAALKALTFLWVQELFEGKQKGTRAKLSSGWKISGSNISSSLSSLFQTCPPVPTLMTEQAVLCMYRKELLRQHAADEARTSGSIGSLLPSSLPAHYPSSYLDKHWIWGSLKTVFSPAHAHFHLLPITLEVGKIQD